MHSCPVTFHAFGEGIRGFKHLIFYTIHAQFLSLLEGGRGWEGEVGGGGHLSQNLTLKRGAY